MMQTEEVRLTLAATLAEGEVWRWERVIAPLDLFEWLSMFAIYPKFYWENPAGDLQIAALGKEWELDRVPKFLQSTGEVRFYGAIPFDQTKGSFFLPSFEIVQTKERTIFAVNRRNRKGSFALPPFDTENRKPVQIVKREDFPSYETWEKKVGRAIHAIQQKKLQKVVLARRVALHCSSQGDPIAITEALGKIRKNSYLFLYQTAPSVAFIGASPEKLYSRQGNHIQSKAIAGTRKRGRTAREDENLQQELLYSAKDLQEFLYVKDFLAEKLAPYCDSHELEKSISILQTSSVQHLYSTFSGELKKGVDDEKLIETLHPTPATLGVPREKAKKFLQKEEEITRGLYAGTIGWISPHGAEIVVGIRSCLLQGKTVHLFSGVGIVDGSDPLLEWEELECKIAPFIRVFSC